MSALLVVILGHRLQGAWLHDELRARIDRALTSFPAADLFVASGGASDPRAPPEAHVIRDHLLRSGVPAARVLVEDASLDTIGNAVLTRLALGARAEGAVLEVVTSCYHRERALHVFRQVFGGVATVQATTCTPVGEDGAIATEPARRQQAERFFEGVAPGDLPAILRRLRAEHALYRGEAFAALDRS